MKDNKIAILVVIVIILLGITVSVLLTQPTENNNQNENSNNIENNENKNPVKPIYKYLVINNSDIWNYANNNWFTEKENRVEDKKFKIYVNNEFFGNYYLKNTIDNTIINIILSKAESEKIELIDKVYEYEKIENNLNEEEMIIPVPDTLTKNSYTSYIGTILISVGLLIIKRKMKYENN